MTGVLTGSLAVLLGACGVVGTEDDRRAAEELAEKHHPGQLTAIGARTLFPGTGGSEVTFAVTDDRDAVVRLRIDTDKARGGLCDGKDCAGVLADAVRRGSRPRTSVRSRRRSTPAATRSSRWARPAHRPMSSPS